MPVKARDGKWRVPLHIHISALFTALLLFSGIILGTFNYLQTTQIILSGSSILFQRIEQQVQQDVRQTYQPIRHLLSWLALHDATQATNLDARLALLKPMAQALRDNPKLASLYLGYADGDFFMLRPLRSEALKQRFQASSNAAFQVWSIDRSERGSDAHYLFFDDSLQLLNRRALAQEQYDPRNRSWYTNASADDEQITTAPYAFFSTAEVGTTLARRAGLRTVLGADLTLKDLSNTLAAHKITPSAEVILFDGQGQAVAYPDSTRLVVNDGKQRLALARDISPVFAALLANNTGEQQQTTLELDNRRWVVSRSHLQEGGPEGLNLALLVPEDELLSDAYRIRWQSALVTLTILLLCLPLGWFSSRLIVKPLHALVRESEAIRSFDFNRPPRKPSPILEVDQLAVAMRKMKETISSFLEITASLSAQTRFDTLIKRVLEETVAISAADSGLIYLTNSDTGVLEPHVLIINGKQCNLSQHGIRHYDVNQPQMPHWLRQPASGGDSTVCTIGFDQAADFQSVLQDLESPLAHLVATGLHNRQGETLGVLVLLHRDQGDDTETLAHNPQRIAFIEAVSGVAAASIESQRLLERQKHLLDAFIQLLAGAIDAKSPHTGGHCQRVPELALMIARAAADSNTPAFIDYQPTDDEWEALHIAAWLHDCGKITTPEYVVDKATKLETLYDRIHEVRMRFEVLKRDAWIRYWQGCAQGENPEQLAASRDQLLSTLDDEFAFIARVNLGGENMAEDDLQRLQQIATRTWLRTLDDRLGLSWEESLRHQQTPQQTLPAEENLLADKVEHLLEHTANELIAADNPLGFKLEVPRYKFNRGELHNLSIGRGTLTSEERYIINHHIVQTIQMLKRLPFPAHLQNVAEIAGGHHEKMDGSGYPKRLIRTEMSLPARMIAVADIFEALTAVDRPYKKGKTLSESLHIMAGMCRNAHIDVQLFELFVRQKIYRRYAERFLRSEQIDQVDEAALLAKAGLTGGNN